MKETISTGITETFDSNWNQYKNMAYKLYLSFNIDSTHREDLIQQGRIGLYKAMNTYKEGAGSTFTSWVWTYMRKEMIEYINLNIRIIRLPVNQIYNKEREYQPTDYINSLDDTYIDSGDPLYSTIAYDDEEYEETDTTPLKKAISQLKPQWSTIMSMVAEGKDGQEIAKYLGISRQAVFQQKELAMKKLKEIMIKTK
jgi:RNA polymerase sporulation-specific sigma factor